MRKFTAVISILLIVITVVMFNTQTTAQTTPPLDDTEYISRTEAGIFPDEIETTLIGINLTTSEIWTLVFDPNDLEIVNRIANSSEIDLYNSNKEVSNLATAYDKLSLEVTQNWVDNRTVELQTCESEATDALALGNWNTLSNGVQNAIIDSLLTCQEVNARVNRKTINSLLDILIAEGIIE